jgi:hypothetical protein
MLTDSQKIDAIVRSLHILTDHLETQKLTLDAILNELQKPPSSQLPDLIKALVSEVAAQTKRLDTVAGILVKLPDEVARRVAHGG